MSERERIALIDRLRALPTETEWLEFKRNRYEPQELGEYLSALAKAAGDAGRHIRERGFDKRYYLDLILALVREHEPVDRKDVDQLLLTKLPERLSQEQKLRKVHNLLQELRRSGLIDNRGSRSRPQWVAVEPASTEDAR